MENLKTPFPFCSYTSSPLYTDKMKKLLGEGKISPDTEKPAGLTPSRRMTKLEKLEYDILKFQIKNIKDSINDLIYITTSRPDVVYDFKFRSTSHEIDDKRIALLHQRATLSKKKEKEININEREDEEFNDNIKNKLKKKWKRKPATLTSLIRKFKERSHFNEKNLYVDPKDLSPAFCILNEIKKITDQQKSIRQRIRIPSYIKKSINLKETTGSINFIMKTFSFYNYLYNVRWINKSYGYGLSRTVISDLWKNFESPKKSHQSPFEDFINNENSSIQKLKKLEKNIKRKKCRDTNLKKKEIKKLKSTILSSYLIQVGITTKNFGSQSFDFFVSLLFSHYMAKKNIYCTIDDPELLVKNHKELMLRDGKFESGFQNFLKKYIEREFSNYKYTHNNNITIPDSSYCINIENKWIGVRLHDYFVNKKIGRDDYNDYLREGRKSLEIKQMLNDFLTNPAPHMVNIIRDKGKSRVITTNHPATCFLKPVQTSIHGFLKKKDKFKYIGNQIRKIVKLPKRSKEDMLLSGDYKNSTDYIPQELTYYVWKLLCKYIPDHLANILLHSLRNEELYYPDGTKIKKRSGQLMGSLTSFPALCLINDALVEYSKIRSRKINGDDVLAIATQEEKNEWVKNAVACGMCVNEEKSHLNPYYATMNSQLLVSRGNYLEHIFHVQISKLKDASLQDYIGDPLGTRNKLMLPKLVNVWMRHHTDIDLFNGTRYDKELLKYLRQENPAFVSNYKFFEKMNLLYMGRYNTFSDGYDPADPQKMIQFNWNNYLFTQREIFIGNTSCLEILRLWREKAFQMIKLIKINLKSRNIEQVIQFPMDPLPEQ